MRKAVSLNEKLNRRLLHKELPRMLHSLFLRFFEEKQLGAYLIL